MVQNVEFVKMQATGNDFVVVDARNARMNWSNVAKTMCDRHFGVGADGLLLVVNSDKASLRMRVFNSDGSEAGACGNGLRCFAKYAVDHQLIQVRNREIVVETMSGVRNIKLQIKDGKVSGAEVCMGLPQFKPEEIPLSLKPNTFNSIPIMNYPVDVEGQEISLSFVSMGNPHAVHFCTDPVEELPLTNIGPKIEHHPLFPQRANFEVVNILSRKQIRARVWERGVGETLACGSGACAIAVIAQLNNLVDDQVIIELPGGLLGVRWDCKGVVELSGPAETVFTGEWPLTS